MTHLARKNNTSAVFFCSCLTKLLKEKNETLFCCAKLE